MSNKLTITIEHNGVGVGVGMKGDIRNDALIHGTAMIVNQACKIAGISRVELFGYASLLAKETPVEERGTCVTIKGGAGDE